VGELFVDLDMDKKILDIIFFVISVCAFICLIIGYDLVGYIFLAIGFL
jgi:hypothetical protein|tara:strand:+ start:847 stop:990 length:144 start_codon:yes stop_codon:yes gene_type:complete